MKLIYKYNSWIERLGEISITYAHLPNGSWQAAAVFEGADIVTSSDSLLSVRADMISKLIEAIDKRVSSLTETFFALRMARNG